MMVMRINKMQSYFAITTLLMLAVFITNVNAADSWTYGATPQLLLGTYSDSEQRDGFWGYGVMLSADYLDTSQLRFAYNTQTILGKPGYPDIDENSLYLSGQYVRFSDFLGGKVGLRADGYAIDDQSNISSGSGGTSMGKMQPGSKPSSAALTDKAKAGYLQLNFFNFANTFYGDLGYARTQYNYQNNDPANSLAIQENTVYQYTATFGLAFNNQYDWLQSRGYFIRLEHGDNTGGVTKSDALELKWLHWFKPGSLLRTHSAITKVVFGKRLFPVDPDARITYSIADLQTGLVSAGLDWKVGEKGNFLVLVAYERYEDLSLADKYTSRYIFSSLSFKW